MTKPLLTFVHLSDTHLPGSDFFAEGDLVFAHAQARAVIAQINALPFPVAFVLHTGDVGNDPAEEASYRIVRDTLSLLHAPLYLIPGNHDNTGWMYKIVAGRNQTPPFYTFESNGVKFICLRSNVPGAGYGEIGAEQLAWLESELAKSPQPVVVALHHHPFLLDSELLDSYVLHDGEALHAVLRNANDRVRCVLLGHIHETVTFARDGITYASAASTMNQLRSWPGQTGFVKDASQMPGFNLVSIMPDGTALIRVVRAPLDK